VDGQYQTRAEVENIVAGHGMGGRDRRGREQSGNRGDYYGPPADSLGGYGAVSSGGATGYYDQQQNQYGGQAQAVAASAYGGYGAAIDAYAAASAATTATAASTGQGNTSICCL
jgi:hypothetical protein